MSSINFQQDVIEQSHNKPVLVDFWAPWCGPCRVLGPTIEQLAEEQNDRWELVKVNTEEEQELAQEYRIMSIPNVKLFHRGEVIGEFAGALPRTALIRWLDEHLPDDRKEELARILHDLQEDGTVSAVPLEHFVQQHPDILEARLELARLLVLSEPTRSKELIKDIKLGNPLYESAEDVRLLAELHELEADGNATAEALLQARTALQQQENEAAIEAVIKAVNLDKSYQDDLPRRLAIALFHGWGPQHELTKKYRWKFDMALY